MNSTFRFAICSLALLTAPLTAAELPYQPELFKSLKAVYEDNFDGGALNSEFWEVRQNTTWVVKDGVLAELGAGRHRASFDAFVIQETWWRSQRARAA